MHRFAFLLMFAIFLGITIYEGNHLSDKPDRIKDEPESSYNQRVDKDIYHQKVMFGIFLGVTILSFLIFVVTLFSK